MDEMLTKKLEGEDGMCTLRVAHACKEGWDPIKHNYEHVIVKLKIY